MPTGEGRKCILHIGMHKTGTSSIQQTIADNFDDLRDQFGVASYRGYANHSWLAPAFVDDLSDIWINTADGFEHPEEIRRRAAAIVDDVCQVLEDERPNHFVLSGEAFSRLPEEAVETLQRFLSPFFNQVFVAIYVCNPFRFANSATAQLVKIGATFENLIANTIVHQRIFPLTLPADLSFRPIATESKNMCGLSAGTTCKSYRLNAGCCAMPMWSMIFSDGSLQSIRQI